MQNFKIIAYFLPSGLFFGKWKIKKENLLIIKASTTEVSAGAELY